MLAGKTREELEQKLIDPILTVKRKRNMTEKIKKQLFEKHKILEGNIQNAINNPKRELAQLDWRVLLLLAEQVSLATQINEVHPKMYYTVPEIKKARQYTGKLVIEGDISLPLTFEEVIKIDYDKYLAIIPVKTLAQMSALLLNYNFDIQREAKTRVVKGETIREATLIMENVLEIKEHLKKNTLEVTQIVINASAGTSDMGEELIYDSDRSLLTITEGTRLDIVDGYHRCKASELAINENPEIDFKFAALILNYTDDQASKYQGQLAKATPLARSRQKQLSEERYADKIVNRLNTQSELAGRITSSSRPNLKSKELVSYDILADTIDKEFNIERVIDVHLVGDYLIKYFNILLEYYEEAFIDKPIEYRKSTLINENNMFIGYLVLARRMYEKNLEPVNVISYLEKIDFDRNNPEWVKAEILDSDLKLITTNRLQKNIKNLFESIEL